MEEDKHLSPRARPETPKISIDNSFKIVILAVDFAKGGKDFLKISEEEKKTNISKLVKLAKKFMPSANLTKLMKLNATDIDRKRANYLQEFIYIVDKLKQRILNAKEQDAKMTEDLQSFFQEGNMILATIILTEINLLIFYYSSEPSSISRVHLLKLLTDVRGYCDLVNTMKFPADWENIINDLSKKGAAAVAASPPPLTTSQSTPNSQLPVKKKGPIHQQEEGPSHVKFESSKDESDSDDNETHTVQIEIRGNTGGFVGCNIEFDLVVTHEDGTPISVRAADFSVEINGPAAGCPVSITSKGKEDGAFRIEFVPTEAGSNFLSIYMHNTLLTSGIKSIISPAGETAFLLHASDLSRGQLQGISVVPIPQNKTLSTLDLLNLKLEDINSAFELLEALKKRTLEEIDKHHLHQPRTNNQT
eukprot:TRINITY_DN7524_c0_g1_i1.p1 TRINITY_DN7524_c0_g1~~TRINITY_DN7524_c0_g1_i1.p1  ORF type:complete len:419 (-),score=84.30 TRINITY_DN7524_c0_g1_i1:10-1266(-)